MRTTSELDQKTRANRTISTRISRSFPAPDGRRDPIETGEQTRSIRGIKVNLVRRPASRGVAERRFDIPQQAIFGYRGEETLGIRVPD